MMTLEEARQKVLGAVQPLPAESAPLSAAFGRVTSAEIKAEIALPPSDNSVMDGYAVRSENLKFEHKESSVSLRVIGRIAAGDSGQIHVESGACVRIFTGSILPQGADAVVMQEDVRADPNQPGCVIFTEPVRPWENIRFRGEDVKAGETIVDCGEPLNAAQLGLLAANGISRISVSRKPVVGFIATGNELREPGQPLPTGAIYESNRIALSAASAKAGAVVKIYPIVRDELAATRAALDHALSECDVVVSSGGVSVGEMDWVKPAFEAAGGKMEFWQIAIRPGKPFVFGTRNGKLFFGLPGNPVSAMVTFTLLVRPALMQLQGARECMPRPNNVVLAEPLANHAARRHFMRISIDSDGRARSAGTQASHIQSAMARASGLVDVPPDTTLPAGATVAMIPWE